MTGVLFRKAPLPLVIFLLTLYGGCWSVNPGFRTAITSKGLDYREEAWLVESNREHRAVKLSLIFISKPPRGR